MIVAFLFVKLLGADVIGDEESRALTAQRRSRRNSTRRPAAVARSPRARSPVGSDRHEHRNSNTSSTSHVTAEELAVLNKPSRGGKYWASQIAIVVGMAFIVLYCIAPFYWMIVSSLRLPTEGREHELLARPGVVRELPGGVPSGERLRPGPAQLGDRVR